MRFNAAITAAIIASAATMTHANASINIPSATASQAARNAAKAALDKNDLAQLVETNIASLSAAIRLDDKPLLIPVGTILAMYENADSTVQNIYNPALNSGCYSNCYGNCHGSRSWR
ncbi:hypothetical protein HX137_02930 [Pseudomonas sp. 165]|uniref:hypothetical protein n=1 Tax=Pseudomonas sp. 165 TaxID=2746722 RepID=UPI0025768F7A|nr:hypothetical protein [Pseudomonas sp. 165]MDM1709588.1 hypothetical protein [Pseudomonas sp. 165]